MKKILLLCLFSVLLPLGAQEIQWIEDFDQALALAQEREQNVLVLLTAPSWCGYCQWLESNTLNDSSIIELLNEKFVACMITDENQQISRFDFEGYPTVQIFSPQGSLLTQQSGALDVATFSDSFSSYGKVDQGRSQGNIHSDNPIKLYGRASSQRTQNLMEYFAEEGISYEFHDVTIPEERQEIKEAIEAYGFHGTIYLPIIIIDGQIFFPPS